MIRLETDNSLSLHDVLMIKEEVEEAAHDIHGMQSVVVDIEEKGHCHCHDHHHHSPPSSNKQPNNK